MLPLPALANGGFADVYVNGTTGDNSYDGSSPVHTTGITGPKKTIAAGIGVVADDGNVHVAAGTYHEYGLHLTYDMSLLGAGADVTIIDADSHGNVITVSSMPFQNNTISGFTIREGSPSGSDPGGGIYVTSAHILTLNDCIITGNTRGPGSGSLSDSGGGICNNWGEVHINRCTISGNGANDTGGGIMNKGDGGSNFGVMEITDSTISGNSAQNRGGGIRNEDGITTMTNCTVSGNTLLEFDFSSGAGISNDGTMTLVNCTVAFNSTTSFSGAVGGGFADESSTTMNFKNTIVSNNTAGNDVYNNGYGAANVVSQGYNIDSENSCGFDQATDKVNTDPLLWPLQNNGGPTFTHAITESSPAYNSGTSDGAPSTDQRGVARPQRTYYDIGAFELQLQQSAGVNTATGTGTATFTTDSGSISGLTASATTACGSPPGWNFPHGFFSFNITDIEPGSTVTITITLPSAVSSNTQYWKCINGSWVNVTSLLGDNDGDNVLTLTITDGGIGDADGAANGTIVDPGGPLSFAGTTAKRAFMEDSSSYMPGNPAHITVKNVWVQQQSVAAGQPLVIYASLSNSGDIEGAYTADLKIDGQVETSRTATVQPNAGSTIQFTVSRSEPGNYIIDIDGKQAYFTVTGQPGASAPSSNVLAIAVFAMFLVGIVAVSVLLVRRSQSSRS